MIKEYLSRNFSIIPIKENEKVPLTRWEHFQKTRPDENYIDLITSRFKNCNWAIVTGEISGVTVIDFDDKEMYHKVEPLLPKEAPVVETRRGFHVYFKYNPKISPAKYNGLDIKNDGGYVLAPPSVVNSFQYAWKKPLNGQIPEISAEKIGQIISLLYGNKAKTINKMAELYKGVKEGLRNTSLSRLCGSWIHDGLSMEECLEMGKIFAERCTPPMEYEEVKKTIQSIFKKHTTNEFIKGKLADYSNKLLTFPLHQNTGVYKISINAPKKNFSFSWSISSPKIKDELEILVDTLIMKAIDQSGNLDISQYLKKYKEEDIIECVNKIINTSVVLEYLNGRKFISVYNLFSDVNISLNEDKKVVFRGNNLRINKPVNENYYKLSLPTRVLYRNIIIEGASSYNIKILSDRMMIQGNLDTYLDELRINKLIYGYSINYENNTFSII